MQNVTMTIQDVLNVALQQFSQGHPDKAKILCQKILLHEPHNVGSMLLLGMIASNANELVEAERFFQQALSHEKPSSGMGAYLCSLLASVYKKQQRIPEALRLYESAITVCEALGGPTAEHKNIYHEYGSLLRQEGRVEDAINVLEKRLKYPPLDARTSHLLGLLYLELGRIDQAIHYCNEATVLAPDNPDLVFTLAYILKSVNLHEDAKGRLLKVLEQHPQNEKAHLILAALELERGAFEASIMHYRKALDINPDSEPAIGSLFYALKHICVWDERDALKEKVEQIDAQALREGKIPATTTLDDIMERIDPARNLQFAQAQARRIEKSVSRQHQNFSFEERKSPKKKLTIGYLSGDFRKHPMFHLTNNMFKHHNRKQCTVIAYSFFDDPHQIYRKKIEQGCDQFVDVSKLSNVEAAQRIYNDQVDILVDLTGYTATARPEIAALRPAPIQMHYLGFIGSLGASCYDYIITDEITTPADQEAYYTEKFLFMPHCYQVNDNEAVISEKAFTRADFGLPEKAFVLCCFNQSVKIEPVMFDVWMRILQRCPNAVLWLRDKGTVIEQNLRHEARKRGVSADRLVFADGALEYSQYLKRSSYADIALDTRVYNGGTVTSNMLWAGVPVITLLGGHFASRMASSIVSAVGLNECVTHSLQEYEDLVVQLATSPEKYQALRQKLKHNIPTTPLFDTKGFVADLDRAFMQVWKRFVVGETPQHLRVKGG